MSLFQFSSMSFLVSIIFNKIALLSFPSLLNPGFDSFFIKPWVLIPFLLNPVDMGGLEEACISYFPLNSFG